LVNPTKWDDPFESFFLEATEVKDNSTVEIISLKNLAADWYGQFWSKKAESDAMWRRRQSNGIRQRVRRHALSQATLYAARPRHSANAIERLCL
jgi:hypothetical protein